MSRLNRSDKDLPEKLRCSFEGQLLMIATRLHAECFEVQGLIVILDAHSFVHAAVSRFGGHGIFDPSARERTRAD